MKRASITFPDDLERKLEHYLSSQKVPPSLNTLVKVALEDYLDKQKWLERDYREASGELKLPTSNADVEPDVSQNHDAYL